MNYSGATPQEKIPIRGISTAPVNQRCLILYPLEFPSLVCIEKKPSRTTTTQKIGSVQQ